MMPDLTKPATNGTVFPQQRTGGLDGRAGTASLLLGQVLYSRAVELAGKGKYREAEGTLNSVVDLSGQNCLTLDLLARIKAQEGRFLEAERLWRQALDLEPGNETAIAALRRISMLSRTAWARFAPLIAMAFVISLAIAGTGIGVMTYTKKPSTPTSVPATAATHKTDRLNLGVDMHGILVKLEGDRTLLIFESGLFNRNTRLTPEAKSLLTQLAGRLEQYTGRISIRVTGFSDSTPMPAKSRYVDNAALGMARALRVVEYMRNTSRLPAEMFSLESQAETAAPYANGSRESRLRNRTVVMTVSSRH